MISIVVDVYAQIVTPCCCAAVVLVCFCTSCTADESHFYKAFDCIRLVQSCAVFIGMCGGTCTCTHQFMLSAWHMHAHMLCVAHAVRHVAMYYLLSVDHMTG